MARRVVGIVALLALVVAAAGCVSTSKFDQLTKRVDAVQAEQNTQTSEMTKLANMMRSVDQSVDKKVSGVGQTVDRKVAEVQAGTEALAAALKKAEARMAVSDKQLEAVAADLKKLGGQFNSVTASVAKAQGMLISNLKSTRDIHAAQYRALSEILETMEEPKEKPKEKPKTK